MRVIVIVPVLSVPGGDQLEVKGLLSTKIADARTRDRSHLKQTGLIFQSSL
jgi:hypothetical protein